MNYYISTIYLYLFLLIILFIIIKIINFIKNKKEYFIIEDDLPKFVLSNKIIGRYSQDKGCPVGYQVVNSNLCKKAIKEIDNKNIYYGNKYFYNSPPGCILKDNKKGYFNTNSNMGSLLKTNDRSVCQNKIMICPKNCKNGCKPVKSRGPYGRLTKCDCPTTCLYGVNII